MTRLRNYNSRIVGVNNLLACIVDKNLSIALLAYVVSEVTIGGTLRSTVSYLGACLGGMIANHAVISSIEVLAAVGAGVVNKLRSVARAGPVNAVCGSACCRIGCSCIGILNAIVPYGIGVKNRAGMMKCVVVNELKSLDESLVSALIALLGDAACYTNLRIGRGCVTGRKLFILIKRALTCLSMTYRIGVIKSGIEVLGGAAGNEDLCLSLAATSRTGVNVIAVIAASRSSVSGSYTGIVVTKSAKIEHGVGRIVLVIRGKLRGSEVNLGVVSLTSATSVHRYS